VRHDVYGPLNLKRMTCVRFKEVEARRGARCLKVLDEAGRQIVNSNDFVIPSEEGVAEVRS
jgi:hypothetical protein